MPSSDFCTISYGQRDGQPSDRLVAIDSMMRDGVGAAPKFDARLSETILLDMWEKWVFTASMPGATSLMRAAVGDIVSAPGGREFMIALNAECIGVAKACGSEPRESTTRQVRERLTTPESSATASMTRDIDAHNWIEADRVVGDLIARGRAAAPDVPLPLLDTVRAELKAYEFRRVREAR